MLTMREKEVRNLLLEKGGWVCFLVGEIIDNVYISALYGTGRTEEIKKTDLCKRFLNYYNIERVVDLPSPYIHPLFDEFKKYIKDFGIVTTRFKKSYRKDIGTITGLIEAGQLLAGLEIDKQIFFLPFHTNKCDENTLISIGKIVSQSIFDYRQKNIVYRPNWFNDFKFENENKLERNLERLNNLLLNTNQNLKKWKEFKDILTTSGEILRTKVIEILQNYFFINVNPIDEFKEDFKILDENDNIICFGEVKGTKKGIKREHINQADSARERASVDSSIPGLLIINNEMDVEGIENKSQTAVNSDQIKHAKNLNILIIRTIDLLFFMKRIEKLPIENRKEEFLSLLQQNGGWLKSNSDEQKIMIE